MKSLKNKLRREIELRSNLKKCKKIDLKKRSNMKNPTKNTHSRSRKENVKRQVQLIEAANQN